MNKYLEIIKNSYSGYWNYIKQSVLMELNWENYFYGLIIISLVVWGLEMIFPWRKNQSIFRKDFWLDAFYMFFNFFIFAIVIEGFYKVFGLLSIDIFYVSTTSLALIDVKQLPMWSQLIIFFILLDFVQWFTHVLLHRFNFLWRFHKVHHSVKEMGFAAHLRYHWMENIFYKPLKVLAVMLLGGFEPEQAFIVHFVAISIGHLNHANIKLNYGPLKYILNNPVMHLYHHAHSLPKNKQYGVNFGISLSIWDYIFKTNYIPEDSGTIELGYEGDDVMPKGFIRQLFYGFKKND